MTILLLIMALLPQSRPLAWTDVAAPLASFGTSVSSALVPVVDPSIKTLAQFVSGCFWHFEGAIGAYRSSPNVGTLQQLQAAAACLDLNSEALLHSPAIKDHQKSDLLVFNVVRLLDMDVDELTDMVPQNTAIASVIDKKRFAARHDRIHHHNAAWFKAAYNREVAGDGLNRLRPLP